MVWVSVLHHAEDQLMDGIQVGAHHPQQMTHLTLTFTPRDHSMKAMTREMQNAASTAVHA
jgi:hypothetical protein